MRIFLTFVIGVLFASVVRADDLTVSAAISLKETLTEIAKGYQASTGNHIIFNFDASGKLAAQILQGAPVDVFISADDEQMNKLARANKISEASRRIIVDNTLVLIASSEEKNPPSSFASLMDNKDRKIAIGEPRTVPAGRYAMQTLKMMHLDQALAPWLVLGESVRQVLAYVKQNQAWAGIVYATDAKQAGDTVKVIATAEPSTHDKIEYPGAVIVGQKHAAIGEQFLDYLVADPAKTIFISHGFVIPSLLPTTRPVP